MKFKKNLLLWNYWANLNQTLLTWSLFKEISIFSNGGHLGYRTALTDTDLKGDHPRIISAKFGWDWLSSFREDFFLILYKHNDELFNIYYGIFYELWTFAYFDRLCKLEKGGDEIKKKSSPLKLLSQSQGSFQQSLVEIGSVVSEERIFFKFHLPFFLICIIGQNRQDPMGNSHKNLLVWNHLLNKNNILMK
jgi:hypothetical protein